MIGTGASSGHRATIRTAWVLARLFLALNDVRIGFAPEEAIRMVLALASGALAEAEVTD